MPTTSPTPRIPRRWPVHGRQRVTVPINDEGGANQSDGPGTNINTIMAQFRASGTLPRVALTNPLYGDFSNPDDIHSQREALFAAEDRFNELPADVRTAADNDWVQFLRMFDNADGLETLQKAGLILDPNAATTINDDPPSSPEPPASTNQPTEPPTNPQTDPNPPQ